MKASLLAVAAGLSLISSIAHAAAVHVETPTIVLDVPESSNDYLTLLSSDDYLTRVSMTETLRRFGTLAVTDITGNGYAARWQASRHTFTAQQGYRITSVDFTFTYVNLLEEAVPASGHNTFASNGAWNKLYFGSTSIHDDFSISNKQGTLTGTLSTGELHRTTPFTLLTNLSADVEAGGVPAQYDWDGTLLEPARASRAELRMIDAVITIHTLPVPEPETYAMLLAGLVLVGVHRGRRRP